MTRGGPRKGAGRPRLPDAERRKPRNVLRMTDAEYAALIEAADAEGKGIGEYARDAVLHCVRLTRGEVVEFQREGE